MERTKYPPKDTVIILRSLFDTFLKEDTPSSLISLYGFYLYLAEDKSEITVSINDIAEKLQWGKDRVRKTHQRLIEIGILSEVKVSNECKPNCTDVVMTLRILRILHRHSIKNKKHQKIKNISTSFLLTFPIDWQEDESFQDALEGFVRHRKQKRLPLTPRSCKLTRDKLLPHGVAIATAALNSSQEHGWTGVFPEAEKEQQAKKNTRPPIYDDGIKYVWDNEIGRYKHPISGQIYIP